MNAHNEQQPAAAQEAVAYLDIGAGGYLDIGSDLPEEQLLALPNGRHALGIIGTYGIDGYVSAPVTAAPAGDDGKPMVLVSQEFKAQAEYDAQISSDASNLLRDNSLGLTGSLPAMVRELLKLASTPAAPGIYLEQFREAVQGWRDSASNEQADGLISMAEWLVIADRADRLLALIDASPKAALNEQFGSAEGLDSPKGDDVVGG